MYISQNVLFRILTIQNQEKKAKQCYLSTLLLRISVNQGDEIILSMTVVKTVLPALSSYLILLHSKLREASVNTQWYC